MTAPRQTWVRFEAGDRGAYGLLEDGSVREVEGELFGPDAAREPIPTGQRWPLAELRLLAPCQPRKFIALWNNYHAAAAKNAWSLPTEPLFFLKPSSSYLGPGEVFRAPSGYSGRVLYEGELGIVIGQRLKDANEQQAAQAIFGYTCVNDVTALDWLSSEPSFAQWSRAKGCDGFGIFGPSIATGLDASALTVRTLVGGRERQNYPCADMILSPARIVALLSREMTLEPGDLIACGTSLGALPMRAGTEVSVVIEGVGTLTNRFEGATST
ncbi:MAG TPA: fumarylacetoacetate hydrolase family protein [Burkholderiaceae bacterium]|nr:fumarylacetoacetate hydrolase family protein [Burkholderiaceae bacterium]